MAPRSLVDMCIKVATDNINLITNLSNMPVKAVSEILRAVKSAHQLHGIESNSDDIWEEVQDHWRRIIKKDFPKLSEQHRWVPSNPKSWFKVWQKYKKLQTEADAAATDRLRQEFAAIQKEKDAHRTTFVSVAEAKRKLPQLPRDVRSAGARAPHWSTQARPRASPLQKVKTQVRAEAKRLRTTNQAASSFSRPTQVLKAPESMIRDKRIERQFDPAAAVPAVVIRAPRARPVADADEKERRDREARLLRIKGVGKDAAPSAANVLTFDDDDDDDDDGDDDAAATGRQGKGYLDDLFDDLENSADDASMPSYSSASVSESRTENAKPRRRGLLSAAPGSTRVTRVAKLGPDPSVGTSTSPPPTKPLPRSAAVSSASATAISTSTQVSVGFSGSPPQKRKAVDIFMRGNKRPRK